MGVHCYNLLPPTLYTLLFFRKENLHTNTDQ